MVRIASNEKGITTYTNITLHDCTEKDLNEFYPLRDKDRETFDNLLSGQNSF